MEQEVHAGGSQFVFVSLRALPEVVTLFVSACSYPCLLLLVCSKKEPYADELGLVNTLVGISHRQLTADFCFAYSASKGIGTEERGGERSVCVCVCVASPGAA